MQCTAVHAPIVAEFRRVIADFDADGSIRCLLLSGAGKAFRAGASLGQFGGVARDPTNVCAGRSVTYSIMYRQNPVMIELHILSKPIVCA
jgi:enoyl-CoA hydratase/carnithine racemase